MIGTFHSILKSVGSKSISRCRPTDFIRSSLDVSIVRFYADSSGATPILMPAMSPTMTEGAIVKWHKKEGDAIAVGDVLFEMETDKATVDVEAQEDGVLVKIIKQEKSGQIKISTLIAYLGEKDADWKKLQATLPLDGLSPSVNAGASNTPDANKKDDGIDVNTKSKDNLSISNESSSIRASASAPSSGHASNQMDDTRISPVARLLIQRHQLNAKDIKATGPNGWLLKGDVLSFVNQNKQARKPIESPMTKSSKPLHREVQYSSIPITKEMFRSASNWTMTKKSSPHAYYTADVNTRAGLSFLQSDDITSLLCKAVEKALSKFSILKQGQKILLTKTHPLLNDDVIIYDMRSTNSLLKPILSEQQVVLFSLSNTDNPFSMKIDLEKSDERVNMEELTASTAVKMSMTVDASRIDELQAQQLLNEIVMLVEHPVLLV